MIHPYKTVKHSKLDQSYMSSEKKKEKKNFKTVLKYKPSLPLQAEREQKDEN